GLQHSPLLQEPVAAALAYSLQRENDRGYWLVYNFGSCTFDADLVQMRDGYIQVVCHCGDHQLGGKFIDWAIVDGVLAPKLVREFHLKEFVRGNKRWWQEFATLKRAAEIAKIEISRKARETLETCTIKDDEGEEIQFECEVTCSEIVNTAEPI